MSAEYVVVKGSTRRSAGFYHDLVRGVREGQGMHLARVSGPGRPVPRGSLTLCGRNVIRTLDIFEPHETSCRECLRLAGIR
jgi:hypothetical protein